MKHLKIIRGFTLVELIVVITIIGILSTIGFVSYSNYLTGARDSSRKTQISKLAEGLQVYATDKRLPIPDDYIEITASGTLIGYQGFAGVDVLESIDYESGGEDPKDNKYFTYYLSKDRKSFQLLTLLEESPLASVVPDTYAADYTNRFVQVYGKKLGVLTTPITNVPVQEVDGLTSLDIVSTNDDYIANISPDVLLEGDGTVLRRSIPNASCQRIKEVGKARGNGTYTINPAGKGNKTVYCEMENVGGGWTMIGRSVEGSSGNIGWGVSEGTASDDTSHYSMGNTTTDIDFSEIMVARYSIGKRIDYAVKFSVDDDDLNTGTSTTTSTSNCELIISTGLSSTEKTWNHCRMFSNWGDGDETSEIWFRDSSSPSGHGLLVDGISLAGYNSTYGAFHNRQGMVFIR